MPLETMSDHNREEVAAFIERHWGSRTIMSSGKAYLPHQEYAILERDQAQIASLVTFRIDGLELEVLTLNSLHEGRGSGTKLMLAVLDEARRRAVTKVWLTTTNDNLEAIRFYQRLGFRMTQVRVGAVDQARKIKPQIPLIGREGIGIHDEIVMELALEPFIG